MGIYLRFVFDDIGGDNMNKRLEQVLTGQEGSYVLPFLWPDEAHPEAIEAEIEAI